MVCKAILKVVGEVIKEALDEEIALTIAEKYKNKKAIVRLQP